jgi:hypothetical protein
VESTKAGKDTSPRQDKHLAMHEAIQDLDSINHRLGELSERLQGPRVEAAGCAAEQCNIPNFMQVLNSGPEEIREKTLEANRRINEISEMLF